MMSQKMMCAGCGMKVSIQNIISCTNLIETLDTWNLNTPNPFFIFMCFFLRWRQNITNPSGFATTLAGAPKSQDWFHIIVILENQLVYSLFQQTNISSIFCQETWIKVFCWSLMKFKAFRAIILLFMSIGNKSINQGKYQLILSFTFFGTTCVYCSSYYKVWILYEVSFS